MIRFIYVILARTFSIIYFVPKMAYYAKHPEKYSEEDCYRLALDVIRRVKKTARVTTECIGKEHLPKESGYILFSNHQGKYDALGILSAHTAPCSVLMDKERSELPIAKQFIDMIRAKRIEKNNPRQQIRVINEIAKEVASGRNYLIFPEGGYEKKIDNSLGEFNYGCFYSAIKAKCPIVPVALIDSYKPFGINSLSRVKTKVIFLPVIPYEEYKNMKAPQLCAYVKEKIALAVEKYDENKK